MPAAGDRVRAELREFLASRRARLTPQEAGLQIYGANRRVPGLRREEVALLSGISVEYYTRLERGGAGGVSDSVLDGLASALQLDEPERDHLYRLVRAVATPAGRTTRKASARSVRPVLQRLLDQMAVPAYVRNGRFDILAANELGRALCRPFYEAAAARTPGQLPNSARFTFLSPGEARDFFPDYDKVANDVVAFLRAESGRDPFGRELIALIGELSTRSEDFRRRWAAHDVRYHRTGRKRFTHPLVGPLELDFEAFELPGDPGQRMNLYSAPPDSPTEAALALLASWVTPAPPRTSAEAAERP